jgi:hypothetical protein
MTSQNELTLFKSGLNSGLAYWPIGGGSHVVHLKDSERVLNVTIRNAFRRALMTRSSLYRRISFLYRCSPSSVSSAIGIYTCSEKNALDSNIFVEIGNLNEFASNRA